MSVQRTVAFADSKAVVEAFGARAERLVEFVCRHVPTGEGPSSIRFEVRGDSDDEPVTFWSSVEGTLHTTRDDGEIAELLMQELTLRLVERSRSGVHIHGGLVDDGKLAVLLPGASGSGKSSLTAWLVARGFALSTDEVVHLPLDGGEVSGFTRPIHLKRGLPSLTTITSGADRASRVPLRRGELVHAEALAGRVQKAPVRLGAIVFPAWAHDAEDTITELPGATATRRLMEVLANARNLPGHGFSEIAALARAVPAFALAHRSVETGERLVRSVCRG
jgi:hypothetical protein